MVRNAPMPSNVSKPRPIGSISWWQPAQFGSASCCANRSRVDVAAVGAGGFVFAFAGGGGT